MHKLGLLKMLHHPPTILAQILHDLQHVAPPALTQEFHPVIDGDKCACCHVGGGKAGQADDGHAIVCVCVCVCGLCARALHMSTCRSKEVK